MVETKGKPEQRVRIGHHVPFEPFGFVAEGRSQGMLIELVEAVLASIGSDHEFVPMALDKIEDALAQGQIEAIAFTGVTAERRARMDFSEPLLMTGAASFTRRDLPARTDLAAYAGLVIVTPAQGPLAASIAREHPELKLLTVDSYDASLEAVLAGTADVAALNFQVGTRLINRKYRGLFNLPVAPYARLPMAFAVGKSRDEALLRAFNEGLATLKAEGRCDAIIRKWMD